MRIRGSRGDEYQQFNQKFQQLEVHHSFFDARIRDVLIWERLRYGVHGRIVQQLDLFSSPPSAESNRISSTLMGAWDTLTGMLTNNPFLSAPAERLYWGHERRKRLDDGYWWDIYCDPIHEEEQAEFVHLESPFDPGHLTPAKTDDVRYVDSILKAGGLLSELPVGSVDLNASDRRTIDQIEAPLEDAFGVDLDIEWMVERQLNHRRATKPLFRRLVNRVNPNVAIVVVSYGKETFVEVCKEAGVPVVELQHGGFGPEHPGYSFPGERTKTAFPDYLFVFGDFWRDSVELPIPRENVVPVGYAHLERQAERYAHAEPNNEILFLSQWSIGEELTRFAARFARMEGEREVIVKLHPGEYSNWESLYPWLDGAPLRVVAGEDPPLYELLASASVQVGVYTTAIYEGLNFGLDTYLLDLPGVSRMRHLVDGGYARLVSNTEEFTALLTQDFGHSTVDVEYFFKSDPISSFESAISEVLASN